MRPRMLYLGWGSRSFVTGISAGLEYWNDLISLLTLIKIGYYARLLMFMCITLNEQEADSQLIGHSPVVQVSTACSLYSTTK